MRSTELTGPDLAYWVARANNKGSRQENNVLRRHFGFGIAKHESGAEPGMRTFVIEKFGDELPGTGMWQ